MDRAFASKFAKCVFIAVCGLVILMGIGSRLFTHIDLALYGYMVGTVVFICGFFYRFIAWGCILSAFVTFPLVFGWMYFTMGENGTYTVVGFGIDIMRIKADGLLGLLSSTTH
jgi:hypothetical protein